MQRQNPKGAKRPISPTIDVDAIELLDNVKDNTGVSKANIIEYALLNTYKDKHSPRAIMEELDRLWLQLDKLVGERKNVQ